MNDKRYALLVGCNQYDDISFDNLISPAKDVESLGKVLNDQEVCGFNVEVLLNNKNHVIIRKIEDFFLNRKTSDLLLLYFSCHGYKDESGNLFLVTKNTHRNSIYSTAIQSEFVNSMMARSRSKRKILILDCCYSGAFAKNMRAKYDKSIDVKSLFSGRGRYVLTASDATEYSFEGGELKGDGSQSLFTHYLIKGLVSGDADLDNDGFVSIEELYQYTYERVMDNSPGQKPQMWQLEVEGNLIVAKNAKSLEAKVNSGRALLYTDEIEDDLFDDDLFESYLSQEPQVGYSLSAMADYTKSRILPVLSCRTFLKSANNVVVTDATDDLSITGGQSIINQQYINSANDASSLVASYLQGIVPYVNIVLLLRDFLESQIIHHQLMAKTFQGATTSIGYCFAINTLSVVLHLPIYNDFAICGRPLIKGVKPGESGQAMSIGDQIKLAMAVSISLRRFYLPLASYMKYGPEFLYSFWCKDKDILGITHFGELLPEIFWLGPSYELKMLELISLRIEYKTKKYEGGDASLDIKKRILEIKEELKIEFENEVAYRVRAIHRYLRSPGRDPHESMESLFSKKPKKNISYHIVMYIREKMKQMKK